MKNPITMNFLFFIGFLVIGYSTSTRFYQPVYGDFTNTFNITFTQSTKSIQSLNNGQRTILLSIVNTLNPSKTELESLWLVANIPPETVLEFLPIFTKDDPAKSDFEQKLVQTFALDKSNGKWSLSQDFIGILTGNNYWWSGYIVIDHISISSWIKNLSITGENQEFLPTSLFDPALFQEICKRFTGVSPISDFLEDSILDQHHLITDMDRNTILEEWKALLSSDPDLTCRFPTLYATQVEK